MLGVALAPHRYLWQTAFYQFGRAVCAVSERARERERDCRLSGNYDRTLVMGWIRKLAANAVGCAAAAAPWHFLHL